jgi:hypothetical protein
MLLLRFGLIASREECRVCARSASRMGREKTAESGPGRPTARRGAPSAPRYAEILRREELLASQTGVRMALGASVSNAQWGTAALRMG